MLFLLTVTVTVKTKKPVSSSPYKGNFGNLVAQKGNS